MKDKIIARLRALFPGVNLSKARLDAICNPDRLSITEETTETEIDEKLNYLNDFMDFAGLAKSDDFIAAAREAAKRKKDEKDPPKPADPPKQEPAPTDPPVNPTKSEDFAKMIADAVTAAVTPLTAEITNLKEGKAKESRLQIVENRWKDANPIIKGLLIDRFNDKTFASDEEFEAFLTEGDTKIADGHQQLADQGLQNSGRPIQPTGGSSEKLASEKELDAVMSNL